MQNDLYSGTHAQRLGGDESGSVPVKDPDTYIMSAAMIDDADLAHIRSRLMDERMDGESKVHWYQSNDSRRLYLTQLLQSFPFLGVTVVHHETGASDRRHRRKCLETLLPLLEHYGCGSVTLESRGGQDQSDLHILQDFRSRRTVRGPLRLQHALGRDEPALWIADTLCGAVTQHRIGNTEYLTPLLGMLDIVEI